MFSYRHGFHAGAHSDVLKHLVLIAVLRHLTAKEAAITVVDTHAGAGLYRLDGSFATTSHEADLGIRRLLPRTAGAPAEPEALTDYLDLVSSFNGEGQLKVYPGSPFVIQQLLRAEARDKLKLFELHPADHKALSGNIAQLEVGRQVAIARADGFEALRPLLPPPSRRGLVLIDPSYEIKSDYAKVSACIQEAITRFPTGTYMVWYPIIPRPEAHELPRRLKTIARRAGKSFVNATLAIGQAESAGVTLPGEVARRPGMSASGVFVINPPHTLKARLEPALAAVLAALKRGRGAAARVETT